MTEIEQMEVVIDALAQTLASTSAALKVARAERDAAIARAEAAEKRAEAAEADLADLRGAMASECADAAQTERAAIVAWLRDQDEGPDSWLWAYADRIRGGEHLEARPAGEVVDV